MYAFEKVGVRPLRDAYAHLVRELGVGAVALVDGGTDILMRGDEAGLGTIEAFRNTITARPRRHIPH